MSGWVVLCASSLPNHVPPLPPSPPPPPPLAEAQGLALPHTLLAASAARMRWMSEAPEVSCGGKKHEKFVLLREDSDYIA